MGLDRGGMVGLDHVKTNPLQGLKTSELDSGDGLGSLLDKLRDSNAV